MTLPTVNNEYIAFLMWFLKFGRKHQQELHLFLWDLSIVLQLFLPGLVSLLELGPASFNELKKATDFQAKLGNT